MTALLVTRVEKVSPHLPEGEEGSTGASLNVVAREKSNDKMIEGARGVAVDRVHAHVCCVACTQKEKKEKEKGKRTARHVRRDGKKGATESTVAVA